MNFQTSALRNVNENEISLKWEQKLFQSMNDNYEFIYIIALNALTIKF